MNNIFIKVQSLIHRVKIRFYQLMRESDIICNAPQRNKEVEYIKKRSKDMKKR